MKKLLLLACCCYLSATVMAQSPPPTLTIKGTVIDSTTNQPVGYATVALEDAKTQVPVKSMLTKDDGSFELKSVTGKPYTLVIIFIGYLNKVIPVTGKATNVSLGKSFFKASRAIN